MAISAGAVWEVQTGGNDANGAHYDSTVTSPGTDYSTSTSPQVTFNGTSVTATTAGVGATITITGYTVASTDNGNGLKISAGTNFTTGYYTITSVNTGANTWTLDRNCTSGAGSALVARMGGCALTISTPLTAGAAVNGNDIYVKSGTYTVTSTITLTGNLLVRLIGYSSTRGDNGQPTVTSSTNSVAIFTIGSSANPVLLQNFIITHTAATRGKGFAPPGAFTNAGPLCLINVKIDGCSYAIDGGSGSGIHSVLSLFNCYIKSSTTNGVVNSLGYTFLNSCTFDSNAGDAVAITNASTGNERGFAAVNCIFYNTTGSGYSDVANQTTCVRSFHNCTFHTNSVDGIKFAVGTGNQPLQVSNCLFVSNTTAGIAFDAASRYSRENSWMYNCAFYNNGAQTTNFMTGVNTVTLTGEPCTNPGSGDFSLNNTASRGAACRAAGFPGALQYGGTGYADIGALQHADPGASSSMKLVKGFRGGF